MKLNLIGYLGLASAAAILLLFAMLQIQRHKVSLAKAENVACLADRANFAATQADNLATNEDLRHRLEVLAEARRVEQGAAAKAIASADEQASESDKKADSLASELAGLYAKDSHASAWGSAGVDAGVSAKLPGGNR